MTKANSFVGVGRPDRRPILTMDRRPSAGYPAFLQIVRLRKSSSFAEGKERGRGCGSLCQRLSATAKQNDERAASVTADVLRAEIVRLPHDRPAIQAGHLA